MSYQTALQIYTAAYKTLPAQDESFALLRKATRMDAVMPEEEEVEPTDECDECKIDVSPMWHDVDVDVVVEQEDGRMEVDGEIVVEVEVKPSLLREGRKGKTKLCHQCFFRLS